MLTIRELIKTLYNAFNQKLKNHRGNWEQNDPTADDYIKNRPFYTDENKVIKIIPKQTIMFSSSYEAESAGRVNISLSPIIELVVGQKYDVVWDGMKYKCTAYEFDGLAAIGSNFIMNGSFDDEPFFIAINKEIGGAYIATGDANSHMVEVTTKDIKKIDKKYLPYGIVTENDLAPVATSGNYNDLSGTPTIYTDVVRYGTTQILTTTQKKTVKTNIGVVGYDASQGLTTANKTMARTNIGAVGYEEQTLTAEQKTQARTNIGAIASGDIAGMVKYNVTQDLTNTQKEKARANIGAGTDNYNDLSNKPCYEKRTEEKSTYFQMPLATMLHEESGLYYGTKTGGTISLTNNAMYRCIVGGISIDTVCRTYKDKNASYKFHKIIGNAQLAVDMGVIDGTYENSNSAIYPVKDTGESFCVVAYAATSTARTLFISKIENASFDSYIYKFTIEVGQLKDVFIPSTVPVIQSAQVGQTIVVKSVDENGKPIEWETMDINEKALPLTGGTLSGDLYANGFYVNSPSIYPSVTFSGTVDEELEKFGMVEFHENHRGSIVSEMQDGSYKEYYQFPRPADTGTENAYYDVLTTKNPSESLAKLGGLPLTGGTLSGDLKLTDGTNQRKINIYRNIGDSQYELQHSINYEGKGFLGVYKNSKEINMIKLGENNTEFSKPIVANNSVIIPSSTEGSTKKFKITVDDSGTITATEITT